MSAGVAVPQKAATVILVRPARGKNWEILLVRRHHRQSFMAGAFVFPGGKMEPSDEDPAMSSLCRMPDGFDPPALLQDTSLKTQEALSFFIAGIRETFEEAGILLAVDRNGDLITFLQNESEGRFAAHRRFLAAKAASFAGIIRQEDIFLHPEALLPYSRWITPLSLAKRFDTRFFLARLPDGQKAAADRTEVTEFLWVTPAQALEMHLSRRIVLMPPTLTTITELADFPAIDDLFAATRKRSIFPILPQEFAGGLKLPHDPDYGLEKYRRPANPSKPCRILLEEGMWNTAFYQDKKSPKPC